MTVYSIIWGRWDINLSKLFHHLKTLHEDWILCVSILPESVIEMKKFVLERQNDERIFYNLCDPDLILRLHLSNYRYLKSHGISGDYFVTLRKDFLPGEELPHWIQNYSTGVIWYNKKDLSFNDDIACQWFDRKTVYKMFYEYHIIGQDCLFNLDVQNDIIEKLGVVSKFEALCQKVDCLTYHHIYPLGFL